MIKRTFLNFGYLMVTHGAHVATEVQTSYQACHSTHDRNPVLR